MYTAKRTAAYTLGRSQSLEICYQPDSESNSRSIMCYVIVTARTLLWTLLTVASTLAMVAAVITPQWLIGSARSPGLKSASTKAGELESSPNTYRPTLGIYNRCTKVHQADQMFPDSCAPYVTGFNMSSEEFPDCWKASLMFFAFGVTLMIFTMLSSVIGCCIRSIVKKSIFTISGTVQACAGLLFILGLILYPAGWASKRVRNICGDDADPYTIADCTLGWAFYVAIGGTLATFVCSVLSVQADISTSSDKVQEEIMEGKNLICLL